MSPEVYLVEKVSKDSIQFIRPSILLIGNNIHCFCLKREVNIYYRVQINYQNKQVIFLKIPNKM